MIIKIGHGIDSHRFSNQADKKLILAGIYFPGEDGLESHSDGDAVFHAITDAILGAAGFEGDIGFYFSDKDPANKGKDSGEILTTIWQKAQENGFTIGNVDINIISQKVRMAPYRKKMQTSIADLLGCQQQQVTIKAKTAEQMGALGRNEGIMATATILLYQKQKK